MTSQNLNGASASITILSYTPVKSLGTYTVSIYMNLKASLGGSFSDNVMFTDERGASVADASGIAFSLVSYRSYAHIIRAENTAPILAIANGSNGSGTDIDVGAVITSLD